MDNFDARYLYAVLSVILKSRFTAQVVRLHVKGIRGPSVFHFMLCDSLVVARCGVVLPSQKVSEAGLLMVCTLVLVIRFPSVQMTICTCVDFLRDT